MTLQQIRNFREIAKTQNFTLAAQNLYVAQSGLSYSIQSLEKEIGVPLFVRKSGKKVMLTAYGQAFLPHAKQILSDLDASQKTIEHMRNSNSGVVTVTYSYNNCHALIPLVFGEFYKEHNYNDITVRFEINQGKSLIERSVAVGKQDLAFSCTSAFEGLTSVPIARQELFLMMPVSHPLAGSEKLTLQEVKDELFVGFYQHWNLSNWITGMFEQEGLQQNVLEYFQDWATQMNYVAMGLGIAISPSLPVDRNYVAMVPIDHPKRFRNIYLHWPKTRKLSASAEYVKDYCIEFFQNHPTVL